MKNLIKLALCLLPFVVSADYYTKPAQFHMRKDGSAVLEMDGHFYEVGYIEHSQECPCNE